MKNMRSYRDAVMIRFLAVILVFFAFNISTSIAASFGSQSSYARFGAVSDTNTWIDNSVQQKGGVLYISSSGARTALDPAEFGGEDSFIWQSIKALTGNSQALTKEDIERLATAIIEKYLLNIDSWPDIKSLLQEHGLSGNDIETLKKKFEDSVPDPNSNFDYKPIQRLFDLFYQFADSNPGEGKKRDAPLADSTSLIGRFDQKIDEFIKASGKGKLVGSIYKVDYPGSTITHDRLVTIFGDRSDLGTLARAVELMQSGSIKDRDYNNDRKSADFYNCMNFAKDTQKMLRDNDIDAYIVMMSGRDATNSNGVGHAAIAIKVGEIEYENGEVVPTFAVVEAIGTPAAGSTEKKIYVMGQIGGDGTPLSDGYSYDASKYGAGGMNFIVDDAIVADEISITSGVEQRPVIQSSSDVYTYTSGSVYVDKNDRITVEGGASGAMIDY